MLCRCETPQDYFEFLIQLKHIYLSVHVQHALFVSCTVKLFKVWRFVNCVGCFINVPSKYNFNTIHLLRENCSFQQHQGDYFTCITNMFNICLSNVWFLLLRFIAMDQHQHSTTTTMIYKYATATTALHRY